MAKRKPWADLEKDETQNGFSMHVLHERPLHPDIHLLITIAVIKV